MKKIVGLGVILVSVLLFAACGNKVTQDDLKKNYWDIKMDEDGMKMTLNTHFTDDQMLMQPEIEETGTTASDEWEQLGEELGKQFVEAMTFTADYTLKDDTIHLKSEDLDLDDSFTVKKDGDNIIFEAKDDASHSLTLTPAEERPKQAESSEESSSSVLAEDIDSSEESSLETTESSSEELTIGKRSNPVPLGTTVTFDTEYYGDSDTIPANVSMTISNVMRGADAYNYLLNANQFNEAAPEGKEWVVFDVTLKLNKGSQDEPYYISNSFTPISSSGEEVSQEDYGTLGDGEEFGYKDIYEGGEQTGKVALLVPTDDDTLVEFTDLDPGVFFKLQ